MKKRILSLILVFLFAFSATAELNVVCSLFPQYDFTRIIAGDRATVTKLLPDGMDSHGYEPTPRDMVKTDSADLFIYTSDLLEGWVKNLSGGLTHVKMVACADGIDLEALHDAWQADQAHEHEHGHSYDAHIWLDPTLAIIMCENILNALIEADPEGEEIYRTNCEALVASLTKLDGDYAALFEKYPSSTLYFGGKFAYSHFLRRYGVSFVTAYETCSDEGEPSVRTIVKMVNEMNRNKVAVVFTDEMSSGEVAKSISQQTGAKVVLFHTAHNVSAADAEKGLTFLDIMYQNLENVTLALEAAQ